ncbi:hypothetical protein D3C86_1505750 [compost metagenome]
MRASTLARFSASSRSAVAVLTPYSMTRDICELFFAVSPVWACRRSNRLSLLWTNGFGGSLEASTGFLEAATGICGFVLGLEVAFGGAGRKAAFTCSAEATCPCDERSTIFFATLVVFSIALLLLNVKMGEAFLKGPPHPFLFTAQRPPA